MLGRALLLREVMKARETFGLRTDEDFFAADPPTEFAHDSERVKLSDDFLRILTMSGEMAYIDEAFTDNEDFEDMPLLDGFREQVALQITCNAADPNFSTALSEPGGPYELALYTEKSAIDFKNFTGVNARLHYMKEERLWYFEHYLGLGVMNSLARAFKEVAVGLGLSEDDKKKFVGEIREYLSLSGHEALELLS